jgi:hypothetical protein
MGIIITIIIIIIMAIIIIIIIIMEIICYIMAAQITMEVEFLGDLEEV